MDKLFEIKNLRCSYDKQYVEGISRVVLQIEHLVIPRGKKVFIVGESGIGKSTILETLGMMNNTIVPHDQSNFIFYEKEKERDLLEMWSMGDKVLSDFRLKNYSFIFQSTNLMRNFTAFENIAFTRMLQGYSRFSSFKRTKKILSDLGLSHVSEVRMSQDLSGGQQQRLAFARAIVPDFTVLFGDEPTGNLDGENAIRVMQILTDKMRDHLDSSAIIVSHDMHLAVTFADVVVKIQKRYYPKKDVESEEVSYGYCDDSCVYSRDENIKSMWSNGIDKFDAVDFENFLRKK